MNGLIIRRHFFMIARAFGLRNAIQLLPSYEPVALIVLMA